MITLQLWQLLVLLLAVIVLSGKVAVFFFKLDLFFQMQAGKLFVMKPNGEWVPRNPFISKEDEANNENDKAS